jgi:hypothetical protein
MPKSVISSAPSRRISRFAGLMSRCTMPRSWTARSPSAACATSRIVVTGSRHPARASTCDSDSPSMNSITRKVIPPPRP